MVIIEFLIKCPSCSTETKIVSQEANPVIYKCKGCGRAVVIHNNTVYTVSRSYVHRLLARHRSAPCGRVIATKISETVLNSIGEEDLKNLHDALKGRRDVSDVISEL